MFSSPFQEQKQDLAPSFKLIDRFTQRHHKWVRCPALFLAVQNQLEMESLELFSILFGSQALLIIGNFVAAADHTATIAGIIRIINILPAWFLSKFPDPHYLRRCRLQDRSAQTRQKVRFLLRKWNCQSNFF